MLQGSFWQRLVITTASCVLLITISFPLTMLPKTAFASVPHKRPMRIISRSATSNSHKGAVGGISRSATSADPHGDIPSPDWWNGDTCDATNYSQDTGVTPTLMASWRGSQACKPEPEVQGSPHDHLVYFYPGAAQEGEFECTELVKRYLYLAFGLPDDKGGINGKDIVSAYTGPLLQAVPNNGTPNVYPLRGDVFSYAGSKKIPEGHTAIVTDSAITDSTHGTGWVNIIEQNGYPPFNGVATHPIKGWVVDGTNDGGTVTAWLTPRRNPGNWINIKSSTSLPGQNGLVSTSAVNANDIWAVGSALVGNARYILTDHWDGNSWTIVYLLPQNSSGAYFSSVVTISSNDVWAVGGYYPNGSSYAQPLLAHWDGQYWYQYFSPPVSSNGAWLSAVTAISSNNVWAVGSYISSGGVYQTLTEQWNGSSWEVFSSPNVGTNANNLVGVKAISATDVWAVGSYLNNSVGYYQTLTEHWDGSRWKVFSSQNVGGIANDLTAVTATSSSNVWAVGYTQVNGVSHTLIERWNGSSKTWNIISSPSPGSGVNFLYGIAAASASDVWAVGYSLNSSNIIQTLTEHWDGNAWTTTPSTNQDVKGTFALGITAISHTNVWLVGYYQDNNSANQTFVAHYS